MKLLLQIYLSFIFFWSVWQGTTVFFLVARLISFLIVWSFICLFRIDWSVGWIQLVRFDGRWFDHSWLVDWLVDC